MTTQEEVLRKKGGVTQGRLGLQVWSDESMPEGSGLGEGGAGTAERAARITRGQREASGDPDGRNDK